MLYLFYRPDSCRWKEGLLLSTLVCAASVEDAKRITGELLIEGDSLDKLEFVVLGEPEQALSHGIVTILRHQNNRIVGDERIYYNPCSHPLVARHCPVCA